MSRPKARAGAALLRGRYARAFNIPLDDVRVEYREDVDDVEVWAPGAGHVWTLGCVPYATTCAAAGVSHTSDATLRACDLCGAPDATTQEEDRWICGNVIGCHRRIVAARRTDYGPAADEALRKEHDAAEIRELVKSLASDRNAIKAALARVRGERDEALGLRRASEAIPKEKGDEPLTDEQQNNVRMHHTLALIHGFNEMATKAITLGEKTYYRMMRDAAEQRFAELGGKINRIEEQKPVLVIPGAVPEVRFDERDIDLMRELVQRHDGTERPNSPPTAAVDSNRTAGENYTDPRTSDAPDWTPAKQDAKDRAGGLVRWLHVQPRSSDEMIDKFVGTMRAHAFDTERSTDYPTIEISCAYCEGTGELHPGLVCTDCNGHRKLWARAAQKTMTSTPDDEYVRAKTGTTSEWSCEARRKLGVARAMLEEVLENLDWLRDPLHERVKKAFLDTAMSEVCSAPKRSDDVGTNSPMAAPTGAMYAPETTGDEPASGWPSRVVVPGLRCALVRVGNQSKDYLKDGAQAIVTRLRKLTRMQAPWAEDAASYIERTYLEGSAPKRGDGT